MTTKKQDNGLATLGRTLALEIGLPTGVYYGLHAVGVSIFFALAASGAVPLLRAAVQFARERTLNGLALVVVVTNVAGMLLTFVSGDARMMLAKDSIGSGITGLVILGSALTAQPLMTAVMRPFLTDGEPAKEAAWTRLLAGNKRFGSVLRRASVLWGIGFITESTLRVLGAFSLPIETMTWLSPVLFVAAFVLTMVVAGALVAPAAKLLAIEAAVQSEEPVAIAA